MSVRLMSAIFESATLGPTERLIMLSLADHADDSGRCYPSVGRICQRTGLSERAVQINVRKLVDQGYLQLVPGGGKGRPNVYFVCPNPASGAPFGGPNPARNAPRTKCIPAPDAPQTPHQIRSNPAPDAPEPSGTIIGTIKYTYPYADAPAAPSDQPYADQVETPAVATPVPIVPRILHALGFDAGAIIPKYWVTPDAALIVSRWKTDLGLSDDQIVYVAKACMQAHGSPAQGPKVLNRPMADYAAALNAEPLTPSAKGQANGQKSERRAVDSAIVTIAADLSAGRIHLDDHKRDPFAGG